jgi:NTP pyrophosphatase (non-canonical NTP hydrolase)
MTFGEYQDGVLATWNSNQSERDRKLNATLGIAGEAGEFADLMKKDAYHGVPADRDKVLKELGDVLYYVTIAAYEHGFSLEQIAVANNKKLAARYPAGFKPGGGIREDSHGVQSAGA